jgi:2-aminoethylphosphonate-pyruvate transaminase
LADAPNHEALVVTGGGTAATEAAFSTFLVPTEKLLVISNGAFGERLAEIATVLGLPMRHLRCEWGEPITPERVTAELDADPEIRAVAMIHHETSVGRLNPVHEVGRLARPRGVKVIVDVISSFGAEELSIEQGDLAVVIGSANKCLHAIPGVSFLFVRDDMWEAAARAPRRSVYLDLRRYRAALKENRQTPFTPAVHSIIALDEALRELEQEGGPRARRARYLALNARVRQGLARLGFTFRFEGAGLSSSLTVAEMPTGESFEALYEAMRRRGYIIYATKGPLQHGSFIVANMGCLDAAIIDAFLANLAEVRGIHQTAARP